ncbi:MAG: 50S ribosomal protein L10 [Promethearchaeati archaeon SRVP18_Atabeyarchaeia-1]
MTTASRDSKTHPVKKTQQVAELTGLIEQSNVIGIVKISNIGTRQLQGIKRSLSGQAAVKVVKNTLVKKAAENVDGKKHGIELLTPLLSGQNAFIFTNMSPYKLAMIFSKSKVKAPAKAGSIALNDVVVPAGNTGFTPGPIISQLGEVKLPTRVEGGSIWITRDTVVAAKGERISQTLAIILSRLGIEPFEVQLRLASAYDNGEILPASVLDLDEEKMVNELREAYRSAINLSVYAGIVNSDTITMFLAKGEREATAIQKMIEGKAVAK